MRIALLIVAALAAASGGFAAHLHRWDESAAMWAAGCFCLLAVQLVWGAGRGTP